MFDYTAIDFETANAYRGSPCAVALVRVRNGIRVAERHWLMRPPELVEHFDSWNVAIHGITKDMVATQPRWREILPSILDFIGNDVVVAHNAGFDIGVIRYACAADNIEWPEIRFLCTMVLARRALSLPTYRLPYVVAFFGGSMINHHDPLADAHAVVDVVDGLAISKGSFGNLEELAESCGVGIGRMWRGSYKGSVALPRGDGSKLIQPELNPLADPDGYLYGRVVVFTGTLMSMTRKVAWAECARVGSVSEENTTKRTNVLVVGDINPAVLRPGSNITGKTRKAFELQAKGQKIEVMTEDDFLRCVDGKPLASAETPASSPGRDEPFVAAPTIPARHRKMALADRPKPAPPRQPRPLRRSPVATTQVCNSPGCNASAAFRTRSRPTWCEQHILELQTRAGMKPLESFTHPADWQLLECLNCAVSAHHRFETTLERIEQDEMDCRACFWRDWARRQRALHGTWDGLAPVSEEAARALASEHGYEYLGPLTLPSMADDPHHVRCRTCSRVSASRLGDISFGCATCKP